MAGTPAPSACARLSAEALGADQERRLVAGLRRRIVSHWPLRLWNFNKHYQCIGGGGRHGVGFGAPAAVGAALANKKYGRLSVHIQNDGDLMYAPRRACGPRRITRSRCSSVMHNNRAYHQEVMHMQRMADRHSRGIDNAGIGTAYEARHRLRESGAGLGSVRRRPHHRSQGPRPGDQARPRRGEARRAGPGRRSHATPLGERMSAKLHSVLLGCAEKTGCLGQKDSAFRGARFLPLLLTSAILVAGLVALLPVSIATQTSAAPAGNEQNGKQSFTARNCATCHGADAQDNPAAAPASALPIAASPISFSTCARPPETCPRSPASASPIPS